MTTAVFVRAHCATNKEVKITISAPDTADEVVTLQDGEKFERSVYDEKVISVKEVLK